MGLMTRIRPEITADAEPLLTSLAEAQSSVPTSLRKLLERRPRRQLRIPRPRLWPRLRRPSIDSLADGCVLAGLASITAACGWIFPPAAPFAGGVFLVALGLTLAGPDSDEPATRIVERWYANDDDGED